MNSAVASRRWRTVDLVTVATLGVAFGVVFWGWGKIYGVLDLAATLGYPPAGALMGGGWLIAGVVVGLVVRRPGAALAAAFIAATLSMVIVGGTEWGATVLVSGLLQGAGAELVFALTRYRRFSIPVAMAAGALSGVFEAFYEWAVWYADWALVHRLVHLGFLALSGALIAGVGGWFLVRALARTGSLDAFEPGREESLNRA